MILLLDQLLFLDLELVLFNVDNHCQQLFFKTGLCDDEVDNCALSGNFWSEMGIGQFCHQEQLEFWIIINNFTTKLQSVTDTLFDNGTRQEWVQCSFNFLLDTFEQHCSTF